MMPQTAAVTSPAGTVRGGGRGILRGLLVALPLLVGGCDGAGAPIPSAVLPPDAVEGAGDPTRAAIINTAYAFNAPASLAGRPDEAARAVANYEHLAVEIPTGPRWVGFSPLVGLELRRGLEDVRNAVGVAPGRRPSPWWTRSTPLPGRCARVTPRRRGASCRRPSSPPAARRRSRAWRPCRRCRGRGSPPPSPRAR